jgi:putative transposase
MSKRCKPLLNGEGSFAPNGQMAKSGLNKSIKDAGWGKFTEMIRWEVESTGSYAIAVNPRNTSQMCSGCGTMVKKTFTNASMIALQVVCLCLEIIMRLSIY